MGTEIRVLTAADWEAVLSIYRAGIATGQAMFETDPDRNQAVFRRKLVREQGTLRRSQS